MNDRKPKRKQKESNEVEMQLGSVTRKKITNNN